MIKNGVIISSRALINIKYIKLFAFSVFLCAVNIRKCKSTIDKRANAKMCGSTVFKIARADFACVKASSLPR